MWENVDDVISLREHIGNVFSETLECEKTGVSLGFALSADGINRCIQGVLQEDGRSPPNPAEADDGNLGSVGVLDYLGLIPVLCLLLYELIKALRKI